MSEQRIRDVVKFGMSPDEIAEQLRAISAAISASAEWIKKPCDPRVQVLRGELDRIEGLKLKHKLPGLRRGDTQIAKLAREVGLEREHKSLFKIFSKLVHPTAYL